MEVKPAEPVPAAVRDSTLLDMVWVCLFSVLLFVSMTIQTGRMTLVLAGLALVLSIGGGPLRRLRERLCVPVLGLLLFALMNGLAAVYSSFGSYAVKEFYKIFAAVSLAVILLVRFDKRYVRGLLWGIAAVCAVIGLLCVDMSCDGGLFRVFQSFAELLGADYSTLQDEIAARINGIYNDANVSASILALGALVSMYLTVMGQKWWKKLLACLLLGASAMSFFLSVSRGAILCFALALLVWLFAAKKETRLPLFFLMVFAAGVTVGLSIPAVSAIGTGSTLPLLLTVASGAVIYALDAVVGAQLSRLLSGHGKAAALAAALLALLCVGYAVAAFTVSAPYRIEENEYLIRMLSLEPSDYTVSGDWDGDPMVSVTVSRRQSGLNEEWENVYNGSLRDAAFEIPADAEQVRVVMSGEAGTELRSVVLSDGTKIKLSYPLLPDFVVARMQGSLFSSSSFLLRVQFMKDAWALFVQSPLIGHGLGSTEGLYTSVQPFFYESLYVHNHILQVMDDMGLLGLAGFLALLVGALWLLVKNLRSETGDLAAALLACWIMMNGHSLMEINFSIRAYQCLALTLLLLPVVLYAKPLSEKAVKWGGFAVSGCIWLYLLVFGALLESHRMVEREAAAFSTTSIHEFMETVENYVRRDVFDHEQNQLTYVGNAVLLNDSDYNGNMRRYAEELRASGTYTACSGLARYYYLPKGQFEELFACSREGIAQEASAADAWNLQLDFYRSEVLPAAGAEHMEKFTDGVLALRDYLADYSQGRMEEIVLTEENQAFLDAVVSAAGAGMSGEELYLHLTQMSDGVTPTE